MGTTTPWVWGVTAKLRPLRRWTDGHRAKNGSTPATLGLSLIHIFPTQLLSLVTNNSILIEMGAPYLKIVGISYIFNAVSSVYVSMQRSAENPSLGMKVFACSMLLNTFLNYCLIFGNFGAPALGITGAAVATLISRIAEFLLVDVYKRQPPGLCVYPQTGGPGTAGLCGLPHGGRGGGRRQRRAQGRHGVRPVSYTHLDVYKRQEYARHLQTEIFPDLRVAFVHGKMKPREKDAVMAAFAARETDILVSTTVIEVGVDVPNAAVMVVENAERFGLSQLHQLRGRVGRGKHQSLSLIHIFKTGVQRFAGIAAGGHPLPP